MKGPLTVGGPIEVRRSSPETVTVAWEGLSLPVAFVADRDLLRAAIAETIDRLVSSRVPDRGAEVPLNVGPAPAGAAPAMLRFSAGVLVNPDAIGVEYLARVEGD